MKIGILGCGCLGGVIAGWLSALGADELWVFERDRKITAAVRKNGIVVREGRKIITVFPRLIHSPEELPDPLDIIILATKCNSLIEAAKGLLPVLTPGGFLVTTQNGLIALDLVESFGEKRILPGCVMWGASMPAPGRYDLTARGPLIVGSLDGGQHPRALKFRDTVEKAFPVKISRHMRSALWSKLTVTASLTSLGAISGMNFGDMLKNRKIRELTLAIGREVVSTARASGIEFTASDNALNVNLLTGERFPPGWIKHLIIRSIGYKHRRTDSAMLASLELGRPTEIDFINGAIVRAAESAGIDTPVNRTIVRIVRELESGSLLPGKENMDRLFDRLNGFR